MRFYLTFDQPFYLTFCRSILSDISCDFSSIDSDILDTTVAPTFFTFYLTFYLACILTVDPMFCLRYPTLLCLATLSNTIVLAWFVVEGARRNEQKEKEKIKEKKQERESKRRR